MAQPQLPTTPPACGINVEICGDAVRISRITSENGVEMQHLDFTHKDACTVAIMLLLVLKMARPTELSDQQATVALFHAVYGLRDEA